MSRAEKVQHNPLVLSGVGHILGMVVGNVVQEEVNLAFTRMIGPQQGHELGQLGLVKILFSEQEYVFLGVDAIRAD